MPIKMGLYQRENADASLQRTAQSMIRLLSRGVHTDAAFCPSCAVHNSLTSQYPRGPQKSQRVCPQPDDRRGLDLLLLIS